MQGEKSNNWKIAVVILIVFLAIIFLLIVDAQLIMRVNEHPEYFVVSETIGMSMYPTVYTGDHIVIELRNSPDFTYKIGNIIVFNDSGQYVGHRVIGFTDNYVKTKGDFSSGIEYVDYDQVVGKVVRIINRNNFFDEAVMKWVSRT
jgi:signal peptidase I